MQNRPILEAAEKWQMENVKWMFDDQPGGLCFFLGGSGNESKNIIRSN